MFFVLLFNLDNCMATGCNSTGSGGSNSSTNNSTNKLIQQHKTNLSNQIIPESAEFSNSLNNITTNTATSNSTINNINNYYYYEDLNDLNNNNVNNEINNINNGSNLNSSANNNELQTLQIKTKSIENTLLPLVNQVAYFFCKRIQLKKF